MEYRLLKGCFIHGLDSYEEIMHSISIREVIMYSLRELFEPRTPFENLMAILRDVVICYDRIAINDCDNFIIQFEDGARTKIEQLFLTRKLVSVLIVIAM